MPEALAGNPRSKLQAYLEILLLRLGGGEDQVCRAAWSGARHRIGWIRGSADNRYGNGLCQSRRRDGKPLPSERYAGPENPGNRDPIAARAGICSPIALA